MSRPRYESHEPAHTSGSSCSGCLLHVFLVSLLAVLAVSGLALASGSKEPAQASWSGGCAVSDRYPDSIHRWCFLISRYSQEAGLDPDLVAALIWQESGGQPLAYSHSGAVGLMQVMPRDGRAAVFRCGGVPCFKNRPSIQELQDPEYNIRFGTRMLGQLAHRRGGDLREALRRYGPMDVGYSYADTILSIFRKYRR